MIQKVPLILPNGISLHIKRDDLLHPVISGNKFRKLKYNLAFAKQAGFSKLVTFGGAFSNHIVAVAAAGKEFGFQTIGIIRGEELESKVENNPSLLKAISFGMKLDFVTRSQFQEKESQAFLEELQIKYGDFYLLPEGGTNDLAIQGCKEIIQDNEKQFSHICCAVGTAGTLSGIIEASFEHQKIIGFSALKGDFLSDVIRKFVTRTNWEIETNYHFGGYGKVSDELISFMNSFYNNTKIPLDPVYTGKMVYGVLNKIENQFFPENSKILMIHTGGLQGIEGMNLILKNKNKELINYGV
ncbi:MAG: pyridoxal-phosphate dependent enzyme [Flavobacterium sp.]|jgi:1-aminocyclopropane-1-carboxylate deaminase|nr:pyridoxal-phosphate dependent enzyme [Flavobacterium sp.]